MASKTLQRLVERFAVGDTGSCVSPVEPYRMRAVATLARFAALESIGAVRLRAEIDETWEPDCDCDDPDCPNKNPESEALGSIAEYRTDFANMGEWTTDGGEPGRPWKPYDRPYVSPWTVADSVWGHVGYRDVLSPYENAYVIDLMDSAIDQFKAAWKDRIRANQLDHSAHS